MNNAITPVANSTGRFSAISSARGIQSSRQAGQQQVQTPAADQDPADSAKRDEQKRLYQLLPRNGGSAGAQGETDGDFALPRGRTHKLQAGDVGAGDEENDQRRADHQEQTLV